MQKDVINHLKYLKDRIDMIVVSTKQKWVYLKISKTSGTSIYRDMIQQQLKLPCFNSENEEVFNKWLNNLKNDKELIRDYFIFTIIREPIDRFISLYHHIIRHRNASLGKIICKIKQMRDRNGWLHKNFEKPIMITCDDGKKKNKSIWCSVFPQYETLYVNNKLICDYVGKYEDINETWRVITKKINIPYKQLNHKNQSKNRKNINYIEEELHQIKEIYTNDFDKLYP